MKRVFAVLLGLLVFVAAFAAPARAEDSPITIHDGATVKITYRLVNTTPTDHHAEVVVWNKTDKPITGWDIELGMTNRILKTSGVVVVSQGAEVVEFAAAKAKSTIRVGSKVSFWYWAEGGAGSTLAVPTANGLKGENETPVWDPTDTDGDSLPDVMERQLESEPTLVDTDGDGLSDAIEWLIGTDPTKPDSDGDGVGDGLEDADADGVNNLDEVAAGTAPLRADTDQDNLTDGRERELRTDPLQLDTDGDRVGDGAEFEIGSNPLVAEASFDVTRSVTGVPTGVSVRIGDLAGAQVNDFTVTRLSADDRVLPSTLPGFLDQGYDFDVSGTFSHAEIAFTFDPATLPPGAVPAIYTWDEAAQRLVEVADQRTEGNRVLATTTHFSRYILLNKTEFSKVWLYTFLEAPDSAQLHDGIDVVFALDSSGSMAWNDPTRQRVAVAKDFVAHLGPNDRGAVVDFDSYGSVPSGLSSDKELLSSALDTIDASGGTSISAGVSTSLGVFTSAAPGTATQPLRAVILLTDGEGSYDPALTQQAKDRGVVIYTVGLGDSVSVDLLTAIAQGTGGQFYPAAQASELARVFASISDEADLLRDSDSDGISDYHEKEMRAGHLVLGNGVAVGLMDPLNPDSDGDGLADGAELSVHTLDLTPGGSKLVFAKLTSHPLMPDTDGDGRRDPDDARPLVFDSSDMVIHQSANREGLRKEPDLNDFQVPPSQLVADDLTFNDYTYAELQPLGSTFAQADIPEGIIWWEFETILHWGTMGAGSTNSDAVWSLHDSFKNGRNGQGGGSVTVNDVYEADTYRQVGVSGAVTASSQWTRYVDTATQEIVDVLERDKGSTERLRVQDDLNRNYLYNQFKGLGAVYPIYNHSFTDPDERALAIGIHQFHGHRISLKNFEVTGNTFTGTLVFHSYDHFGLDPDDGVDSYGFVDWFTLQHYDRFDGEYVPPLAVVDQEVSISGNF